MGRWQDLVNNELGKPAEDTVLAELLKYNRRDPIAEALSEEI